MMAPEKDRRGYKQRYPCHGRAGLFLYNSNKGQAATATLFGQLRDISLFGAGLELPAILVDRTHLVYAPQENSNLLLQLAIPMAEEQTFTFACQMRWYDKNLDNEIYPFLLGVEFTYPITTQELKMIRGKDR